MPITRVETILRASPPAVQQMEPEQVVQRLRELCSEFGLRPRQVVFMFAHQPGCMLLTPIPQLKEKLREVAAALQVPEGAVLRAALTIPSILCRSTDTVKRRVVAYAQLLKCSPLDVLHIMARGPEYLTDTPSSVRARMTALGCVIGRPRCTIAAMLQARPDLVCMSAKVMNTKVNGLMSILDKHKRHVVTLIVKCPELLRCDLNRTRAVFQGLQAALLKREGFVYAMTCHAPQLLLLSPRVMHQRCIALRRCLAASEGWQQQFAQLRPPSVARLLLNRRQSLSAMVFLAERRQAGAVQLESLTAMEARRGSELTVGMQPEALREEFAAWMEARRRQAVARLQQRRAAAMAAGAAGVGAAAAAARLREQQRQGGAVGAGLEAQHAVGGTSQQQPRLFREDLQQQEQQQQHAVGAASVASPVQRQQGAEASGVRLDAGVECTNGVYASSSSSVAQEGRREAQHDGSASGGLAAAAGAGEKAVGLDAAAASSRPTGLSSTGLAAPSEAAQRLQSGASTSAPAAAGSAQRAEPPPTWNQLQQRYRSNLLRGRAAAVQAGLGARIKARVSTDRHGEGPSAPGGQATGNGGQAGSSAQAGAAVQAQPSQQASRQRRRAKAAVPPGSEQASGPGRPEVQGAADPDASVSLQPDSHTQEAPARADVHPLSDQHQQQQEEDDVPVPQHLGELLPPQANVHVLPVGFGDGWPALGAAQSAGGMDGAGLDHTTGSNGNGNGNGNGLLHALQLPAHAGDVSYGLLRRGSSSEGSNGVGNGHSLSHASASGGLGREGLGVHGGSSHALWPPGHTEESGGGRAHGMSCVSGGGLQGGGLQGLGHEHSREGVRGDRGSMLPLVAGDEADVDDGLLVVVGDGAIRDLHGMGRHKERGRSQARAAEAAPAQGAGQLEPAMGAGVPR